VLQGEEDGSKGNISWILPRNVARAAQLNDQHPDFLWALQYGLQDDGDIPVKKDKGPCSLALLVRPCSHKRSLLGRHQCTTGLCCDLRN